MYFSNNAYTGKKDEGNFRQQYENFGIHKGHLKSHLSTK